MLYEDIKRLRQLPGRMPFNNLFGGGTRIDGGFKNPERKLSPGERAKEEEEMERRSKKLKELNRPNKRLKEQDILTRSDFGKSSKRSSGFQPTKQVNRSFGNFGNGGGFGV